LAKGFLGLEAQVRRFYEEGASMTKEQEALKQALEALEHAAYCVQNNYCPDKMGHDWDDTITAIKEALAQPEQIDPNQWAFDNGLEST
jgi:hypothetical protein